MRRESFAAADMPSELVERLWDGAKEAVKVDGWLPFEILTSVKEETLFEAVRQRGSVTDLYKSLEGIIRRTDSPGIAGAMHHLKDRVRSSLFRRTLGPSILVFDTCGHVENGSLSVG